MILIQIRMKGVEVGNSHADRHFKKCLTHCLSVLFVEGNSRLIVILIVILRESFDSSRILHSNDPLND